VWYFYMKSVRLLILSIFLMLLTSQANAETLRFYNPENQGLYSRPNFTTQSPIELLKLAVQYLQAYIKQGNYADQNKILPFLDAQMSPFFDFEQMARWSAGRHYNRMNSAQKYIFQSNLKKLFFVAFSRIITAYGDAQPRVEFLQPRRKGYNEIIVSARVYSSRNQYPIRIDFRFLNGIKGWKIYDVGTNGNSAVAYYRSYFSNLIRNRGYNAFSQ